MTVKLTYLSLHNTFSDAHTHIKVNKDIDKLKVKHGNWAELWTPFRMDTPAIPSIYCDAKMYGNTEMKIEHRSYTKTQICSTSSVPR